MSNTTRYQDRSYVRTHAAPRATPNRSHQIGVRVTDDELKRLELRARVAPNGPRPLATYLRLRGLDAEPSQDPTPELVEELGRVGDLLVECRRYPHIDRVTRGVVEKAIETLRELIAKIG